MNMVPSILLGKLSVRNGEMHFLYTGDQRHRNLLAIMSRLLITEEDTNTLPSIPSPDTGTWRYYAEFPQSSTLPMPLMICRTCQI